MTAGLVSAPLIIANTSLHTRGSRRDIDTDTPIFIQSGTNLGTLKTFSSFSFRSSQSVFTQLWPTSECVQLCVCFCRYSWSADLLHPGWIEASDGPGWLNSQSQEVQQTHPAACRSSGCQSRCCYQVSVYVSIPDVSQQEVGPKRSQQVFIRLLCLQ